MRNHAVESRGPLAASTDKLAGKTDLVDELDRPLEEMQPGGAL